MAQGNRDAAASVGLPSAVTPHPGWAQHIDTAKPGASAQKKQSSRSHFRQSRRQRTRGT